MRRQFRLPESDEASLNARGLDWETFLEGQVRWVCVHDFPIPAGYTTDKTTAVLRIGPSYPDEQIDMVYFCPALALANGKPIAALSAHAIEGKPFQQWSRHRTAQNPWRPGEDDIEAHLLQVGSWLRRELGR